MRAALRSDPAVGMQEPSNEETPVACQGSPRQTSVAVSPRLPQGWRAKNGEFSPSAYSGFTVNPETWNMTYYTSAWGSCSLGVPEEGELRWEEVESGQP
ncbi:hypothetical protein AAFF_G00414640 [Aldrovandia affinis]|uniref:Uncharacterized protein n=1 Tax=Aldrovandia affinis TaxID=143900 RepID=A0AAD7SAQ6_9TELE|nr:hypothetical protein AAFF_G00414640 [Aldrovandia affinis]